MRRGRRDRERERERERKRKNAIAALKEIAIISAGGLTLAASFYVYAYFAIPSIFFPFKDCSIMTYLPNPLFIFPMLHFIRFITYVYCFFTNGDCEYLNGIVTGTTYIITITITLCVYLFYIVPSLQPPPSRRKPSIISPGVSSCIKNLDVCQSLANSQDFLSTLHRPILYACCVPRRSVPRRFKIWDLAMKVHDHLNGTETGYVAFSCMAAYVENISKASEMAAWASITFEAIVNLIFFLMPVKKSRY